jgi:protein-disulfide isomerase
MGGAFANTDLEPVSMVVRRAFVTALSVLGLAALAGLAPVCFIGEASAQEAVAALVAKPVALPDMALGPATAKVTITEYASMSCPHCAAFEQNVFPMLRTKYVDTGKVRYVFREFPLDITAAATSMVARCIADGNAEKFFGIIDTLFKQQDAIMMEAKEALQKVAGQSGMDDKATEACIKNQAMLDKLSADRKFAQDELKVDATPIFFINGEMVRGALSFEEMAAKIDAKIDADLKK